MCKTRFLTVAQYFVMRSCCRIAGIYLVISLLLEIIFQTIISKCQMDNIPEIPFEHHRSLLWANFLGVKWLFQSWTFCTLLSACAWGQFLESLGNWHSQECEPFPTALFTSQLLGSWLLLGFYCFLSAEVAWEHTLVWRRQWWRVPLAYCHASTLPWQSH